LLLLLYEDNQFSSDLQVFIQGFSTRGPTMKDLDAVKLRCKPLDIANTVTKVSTATIKELISMQK